MLGMEGEFFEMDVHTLETNQIADLIDEGIRIQGFETDLAKATDIKKETDLEGFDAYVFGSATYHGDMMQPMKTMLFLAEKAGLDLKLVQQALKGGFADSKILQLP